MKVLLHFVLYELHRKEMIIILDTRLNINNTRINQNVLKLRFYETSIAWLHAKH